MGRRTDIRRFLIPDLEGRYNRPGRRSTGWPSRSATPPTWWRLWPTGSTSGAVTAGGDRRRRYHHPSEAVGREVVRRALRLARGPHAGSHDEVIAVMEVARGSRRGRYSGGLVVRRRGALVVIETGDTVAPSPVDWAVPGPVRYGSWELDSWVETAPRRIPARRRLGRARR